MLEKNLISFEPTSFFLKLTLFLSKTNSHSICFFLESDLTFQDFIYLKHPLQDFSSSTKR